MILPFLPNIKSAIFSDGVFKPKRAAVLLTFMVTIGGMVYVLGVEDTEAIIEMTDEISDSIGYGE